MFPDTVTNLLSVLVFFAQGINAPPAPTAAERELAELGESLARTQSLTVRFKQTRRWAALADPLVTEGTLRYQKGGKLVWHTAPPAESEVIIDGKTVVLRYPAVGTSETVDLSTEPGMARVFESIGAVLQADLERLRPLFDLTIERRAPRRLLLTPKTTELARVVQRIILDFDRNSRLTRVRLFESSGDRTEVVFHGHVVQTAAR